MLKACTPRDLQTVGFLSVLAISGSVALLSFLANKPKLIPSQEEEEDDDHDHDHDEEVEEALTHSVLDSSCQANAHSPTHEHLKPTPTKIKKVRFAPDVVHPPSDGQRYRPNRTVSHGAHTHAHALLHVDDQVLVEDTLPPSHLRHCKPKCSASQGHMMHPHVMSPNDQRYKSTRRVSRQDQTHAHLSRREMSSKLCKDSQGCEMHGHFSHPPMSSKSTSSIPANRLALYKGLWQNNLQYSLHRL